jgi:hypothetical protein
MNWRGRPLETHEVVVETIAATTTKTGLTVRNYSVVPWKGMVRARPVVAVG